MADDTVAPEDPVEKRRRLRREAMRRYRERHFPCPACVPVDITVLYEGSVVTLADARASNLIRYFTGRPCKRGHIAQRRTKDRSCIGCAQQVYRKTPSHKETLRAYRRTLKAKAARRVRDGLLDRRAYFHDYRRRPERREAERRRAAAIRQTSEGRAARQAYRQSDVGKASTRLYNHSRRSRIRNSKGSFTREDYAHLLRLQKKCHVCRKPFTKADPAELDHIVALADGGLHDRTNIALAHRSCNKSKGARRTHLI
jgi:5-methylcytosine-specific restriction endonuclease McrA